MVKESPHVKGTNVGLDAQDHGRVGREIQNRDRPQEEAGDGPEPLWHRRMDVTKGALDASGKGFRHAEEAVDGKGHALADPEGPFDGVCVVDGI